MATAPSPNDLTRQQLDELDALLQRMLSVPLAPPDAPLPAAAGRSASDAAAPLPPSWRVDAPAPTAGAATPHITLPDVALPDLADPPSSVALKFEPPAPPPVVVPPAPPAPKATAKTAPTPPPPTPAPAPTLTVPPKAASVKPVAAPALKPAAAPAPKPVVAAAPAAPAITPPPSAPPVALPLLPFVALNVMFDAACGLLGPFGRVLRSGPLKHLYGLVGLGLIAYTAAHIAKGQGWIALPFPLPWPR